MAQNAQKLVKRFVAPTMTRALEMVQQELGPEAVILSSKRLDKGVEIVTSLEPDLPTRGADTRRQFGQNFDTEVDTVLQSDAAWQEQAGIEKAAAAYSGKTELNSESALGQRSPEQLAKEIEAAREKMFAAKRRAQTEADHREEQVGALSDRRIKNTQTQFASQMDQPSYTDQYGNEYAAKVHALPNAAQANTQIPAQPHAPHHGVSSNAKATPTSYSETLHPVADEEDREQLEHLKNDIADMRMLLEQQLWKMSDNRHQLSNVSMPQQVSMPSQFSVVTEHLNKLGLTESLVNELLGSIGHHPRANQAWRACMATLAKRLPVCDTPYLDNPGIYAFLGQTGVGKTTSIAKLAAQYVLKHGPGKVALVTTDTFRVGAFDQLRTMGRILNVPVKVVDAENSLLTLLASLRQFPFILIDTAGFRIGDPLLKAQLAQLEKIPSVRRVLVMSCNSQLATMKASIHAHKGSRGLHSCVLTKVDESASIGEALSVVINAQLPIAYTTDGQDIPKDITQATAHGVVAKAVKVVKSQGLHGEHSASM